LGYHNIAKKIAKQVRIVQNIFSNPVTGMSMANATFGNNIQIQMFSTTKNENVKYQLRMRIYENMQIFLPNF